MATDTMSLTEATVRELEPGLIRYARQRVGKDELARDLVQETWLAAYKGIGSFAGRSSLKTWLVSILRRKIVDHHRRKRPTTMFEEHHTPPMAAPRERLDDQAAIELVEKTLPSLPRRERQAVTLVDVHGVDRDDAADQMGVSRGALRVMLHRGRSRIKKQLEASDFGIS
ncbi:MAG: sigma-70 family RNA polymerase sigma factor [Myxococcota bacterium]